MDILFFIVITLVVLTCIFNVVYYIPNKLKKQEEKQSLYANELYIRINMLESRINKLIEANEND